MVIWVIGLAGAGKTTLGREMYRILKPEHKNLVLLDGDMIREVMGEDLGHSIQDRRRNADRICRLCRLLDDQNINVICCILSLFHESQAWNRANLKQYFEVYLDVSLDVLKQRDQKNLYSRALRGEVTDVVGVDIPFSPPKAPDYILKNDEQLTEWSAVAQTVIKAMPRWI